MELFLTVCVTGVVLGLLYGLFGLGMGLVLRASGELNLAHGDTLMLATYAALGTRNRTGNRPLAVLVDVALGAAIGVVAYLAVYAPSAATQRVRRSVGVGFLPSLGVALLVRNVADRVDRRGSRPVPALFSAGRSGLFYGYRLPQSGWWLLGAAIVVPLALAAMLRSSRTGQRLRAVAEDPVLAQVSGIPVTSTLAITYALAGAVGGLGGALFASFFGLITVSLGWHATLKGFVAAVLGGAGWLRGALIGGLVLGLTESAVSAYVSSSLEDVAVFALLIGVLLVAPEGVLARARLRAV